MNVLHVGIFDDHFLGGDLLFETGLRLNGCEVQRFDYRAEAVRLGSEQMRGRFIDEARGRDLVFIGKGELLDRRTLRAVRRTGTHVLLWYGDIRPRPEPWLLDLLGEVDCFFMSSGGETLREHHRVGEPGRSSYFFHPADPEVVRRCRDLPRGTRNVVFTGTRNAFAGPERRRTLSYLRSRPDAHLFGGAEFTGSPGGFMKYAGRRLLGWQPRLLRGRDYVAVIRSARIGIGVGAVNHVHKYTSDRLAHYLAFGTFFLCWRFPGVEELFREGTELECFSDLSELDSKLDRYLADDEAREAIARAGQRKMLEEYTCRDIVAMMLDVARSGRSARFSWVEVYE